MSHKHPGTSGLMPYKRAGCSIRPDLDAFPDGVGFDFSAAAQLCHDIGSANVPEHFVQPADKPADELTNTKDTNTRTKISK